MGTTIAPNDKAARSVTAHSHRFSESRATRSPRCSRPMPDANPFHDANAVQPEGRVPHSLRQFRIRDELVLTLHLPAKGIAVREVGKRSLYKLVDGFYCLQGCTLTLLELCHKNLTC